MNSRITRALLALSAVSALLAALAVAGGQAWAQSGNNTNPRAHATPLRNGVAVNEFVIEELGGTALTHVELRLGSGNNGQTRATYQDFGSVELWLEERPGSALHDTSSQRLWYYSGGANAGQRLTLCGGGATHRCQLLKAEWKTLAGQSGVTSGQEATTNVEPIRIAFNIPSTITAGTIRLGVVHYSQFATRNTGGGSQWGPHTDWTVLTYGANITPVDDQDRPFWVRNSLTDSTRNRSLQYPFAAGQLSHVRLNAGLATALGDSRDTITYAQFTSVSLTLEDSSSSTALNSNNGAHQNFFTTTAGANLAACGTSGNACVIDKAEWQALAGQTGAAGTVVVKPIRIAIKVPREFPAGTAYNGVSVKLEAELAGTDIRVADREATFKRLSAHITRLQTAKFETAANGRRVVTVVEPSANSDVADGDHAAKECRAENLQGQSAAMTDCYRSIEVGEGVYLENILRVGGAADNTGSSTATTRTNDEWLRADAARHGAIFDRVQVQAWVDGAVGGGVVAIGSLCPIGPPAVPEHTSALGNTPRARTVEGLATCTYRYNGATYWGGKGIEFFPTAAAGKVVTIRLSYHKGADDPATTGVDESLVARDTLPITVAAAADNTDTGNGGVAWITGDENPVDESLMVAELGSRSREDSLVLLIGHRRNRGIPEFWGGLTAPTGPGSIKGATYATVSSTAAVALTVPAGGGSLSLLGTDRRCTARAAACTLTLTRDDLKRAALYRGPVTDPATTVADIADTAPYWPARLQFEHADPSQDVTITGVLTLADNSTTDSFSYVAKGGAANPGASIIAWLPEDADDTLAPSQTAKVAVGYRVPTAAGDDDSYRLWGPTPKFYEITGYSGVDPNPTVALISGAADPLPVSMWNTYLQISGPATWTANGSSRLQLDASSYTYYKCVAASTRSNDETDTGRICYITDADGDAPELTVAGNADAAVSVIASVPLWTMFGAVAPNSSHSGGPNHGYFRAQNVHSLERFDVFGRAAEIPVRRVVQVNSVTLARKAGAAGAVKTGDPARLRLGILNENDGASDAGAISSVTLTTTSGKLRAGTSEGGDEFCQGSTTCSITIGTTTDANTDDLASAAAANPALVAGIFVDLYDVKTAGTATVSATIVAASASGDPVFRAEPLTIVFSGTARSLSLSEKLQRVNAYGTPDADAAAVAADPDADPPVAAVAAVAKDDRDVIKIALTAADSRDQTAGIPVQTTITVTGPGGAAVPAGALSASIPSGDDGCNTGRTACNIVIDVNAARTSPLAPGIYTVKVSSGTLTAAEATFGVAGDPAELDFAVGDPGAIGTQFEAEITVTDAAGEPVADGTEVAVTVQSRGRRFAAPVTRISPAVQRTANGRVTAKFVVIGREVATIKAEAGGIARLAIADTRSADSEQPAPAASLTSTQPNSFTAWTGTGTTTASRLLADTPNANRVFLWNGVRWLRYAEVGGTTVPGSLDYLVQPGDVLWLGGSN